MPDLGTTNWPATDNLNLPADMDTRAPTSAGDGNYTFKQWLERVTGILRAIVGDSRWTDARNPLRTVVSKTANYTAAPFDVVLCDATSGAFTITLPAPTIGRIVTVKKTDSSANTVTVLPASGTVDGAASFVVSTRWESDDVIANGTNWYRI